MSRTTGPVRWAAVAMAALLALTVAGCGDDSDAKPSADGTSPSSAADAGRDTGEWLLRFTTAEGEDGEEEGSVYVRFTPSTGAAVVRALPALRASDATQDQQALLVSADHAWAIPDTGVSKEERTTGALVLHSLTSDATETLDFGLATGKAGAQPVAWAFDPTDAGTLRVVDSALAVWQVDLATKLAQKEGQLAKREGWIFGNGFDKNTGEPYIESIDSDETEPAGNGDSDVRAVERQGGTLIRYDGEALEGLPKPPCGFAGGFEFADGDAWLFCADTPSIAAYRLGEGDDAGWVAVGKASTEIVPDSAVELSFALPPVS